MEFQVFVENMGKSISIVDTKLEYSFTSKKDRVIGIEKGGEREKKRERERLRVWYQEK